MKKILLILLLILTSCGARKVQVEKTEIKTDSVVETKSIVKAEEQKIKVDSTNVSIEKVEDEIIFTPIDTCKEIIVDGKKYKNVVLRIKKIKTNTLYSNNKIESETKRKDSIGTTKATKTKVVVAKTKNTERESSYYWIIWLILALLILNLLWKNRYELLSKIS